MNATSISLLNGGHFDFANPDASEYTMEDLARGLSHESRFCGATDRPYFVAQHSVLVSHLVPHGYELDGLLHDVHEGVAKDIPKPLKNLLPDYMALEQNMERSIFKRYGVQYPLHPCIKDADNRVFVTERRDLQPGVPLDEKYNGIEPMPNRIIPWDSRMAFTFFMRRFNELTKGRK